ncbi:MAG TPA: hypothetical protein PKJ11_01785 [bacterium]|jgi:hypothetical protein|nr:MAG: hypothetical protein BWX53_00441 [Parcubacteria group bacterium ADurb.Bin016]HNQ45230.1 hypothetical protein [bacterium]HRS72924.1 hypothetical protein [Patescibacteria group bacterium]HNU90053.1 hypothetical protein [bacterium]HOE80777.1 hypothetical protein [bacterium]
MKLRWQTCLQFNDFLYGWLSVGLGLFLLSEAICPGFVQPYINLNLWLLFWAASAILEVLLINNEK